MRRLTLITFFAAFPKASFVARSRQQLKTAVDACVDQSKKISMSNRIHMNAQRKFFNAIVAVNTLNGIGVSHGVGESKAFAMPWKLTNEFRYLRGMLDHDQEMFEKQGA